MKHAWLLLLLIAFTACDKGGTDEDKEVKPLTDTTTVVGYGIMEDFAGIWNGPVNSTSALGSYPEWIVDFRPISAGQLTAKNELDSINDIFMGFFIAKAKDKYVMTFRNGGGFAGMQRVSYACCDSSYNNGTERYYRFVDFKAGFNRLYIEFRFRNDSVHMQSFTNKYNTLSAPTLHMQWDAKRMDGSASHLAAQQFGFPKKISVKDFATTFDSRSDAVFYNVEEDPYSQSEHPYLGNTLIDCSFGSAVQTQAGAKVILIITTQPLFAGLQYTPVNLKYRSRYVLLTGAHGSSYNFDYMHPGTYYLNAIYDTNGNLVPESGEFIQFPFDKAFTLSANDTIDISTQISLQIP
ncbi:hypothetical protein BH09BAC1_BH09BAC1_19770 [soil metagenome]